MVRVIEYTDLPDALAQQTNADGSLTLNAGSIALHVIAVAFVAQLNDGPFALPPHRAIKKVPCIDPTSGDPVNPSEPNAVKLETFVFDALPLCTKSVVLQTPRPEEFGPIKQADGPDSAASSRRLQSDRAGRWLEAAGVVVPWTNDGHADATLEISPLTAIEPSDLASAELPDRIEPGSHIAI